MAKYTERLLKIASYIAQGETVADIGPDHGYLGEWLIRNGRSPRVIMTDIAEGPLAITRTMQERSAADDGTVDFRLGDGLAPLAMSEADTVVIAGMGGETIAGILSADTEKTLSFAKYLLQPRTKTEELLEWLRGRVPKSWQGYASEEAAIRKVRFTVIARDSATERGRTCEIFVVKPEPRRVDK